MHKSGHGGVMVLAERVVRFPGDFDELLTDRNMRAAQAGRRTVQRHQARIVRRQPHRQRTGPARDGVAFFVGQDENPLHVSKRFDPVANLPAPIEPVGVGRRRKEPVAEGARALRKRKRRLIGAVVIVGNKEGLRFRAGSEFGATTGRLSGLLGRCSRKQDGHLKVYLHAGTDRRATIVDSVVTVPDSREDNPCLGLRKRKFSPGPKSDLD